MRGRNLLLLEAEWRNSCRFIQLERAGPPRAPGSDVQGWRLAPTARCPLLWRALEAEGQGRDEQSADRPDGFPQPDASSILEAVFLAGGCVSQMDLTLAPVLRFAIRVAGRPGRDNGYLSGTVVAILYKQTGMSQLLDHPNVVYARLTMVPEVSLVPILWMAIEDRFLGDIAVKRVLLAMVAAFGQSGVHWRNTGAGASPRLGHGWWLPVDQYQGPNLFGRWFGGQNL